MGVLDFPSRRFAAASRPAVDDAYMAWFSAHARCSEALKAWNTAAPGDRAIAYRVYRARLEREEMAAAHLQRVQDLRSAA